MQKTYHIQLVKSVLNEKNCFEVVNCAQGLFYPDGGEASEASCKIFFFKDGLVCYFKLHTYISVTKLGHHHL